MDKSTELSSEQKRPLFFKVLINPDFSTRLQIPPTFVRKYGKYLPSKILLQNYSKKSWEVQVSKMETSSYLGNGWERFVEDNGLESGDFVVFRYWCNSTFKFKMFGKTWCEKKVERTCEAVDVAKENQEQVRDDAENAKRKVIVIDDSEDDQSGRLKRSRRKRRREEGATRIYKGINYNTTNPSFQVTLTSAYVSNYLPIPSSFLRKHMKMEDAEIKLKMEEKMWRVNVKINYWESKKRGKGRFTAGWMRFVRDNNLKQRDVCFFEMLKTDASVFGVGIVRKTLVGD